MPFTNPVTIRSEPVQKVIPDGAWEAQVVCDIDDWPVVLRHVVGVSGGHHGVRLDGHVVEAFALHDTRTAAEGTIRRWTKALRKVS